MIIIIFLDRSISSQFIKSVIESRQNSSLLSYYQYRLTQLLNGSSHNRKKTKPDASNYSKKCGIITRIEE